ncbi:hypothetical protein CARUB_v10015344mg [Capsella rubella]|uniref:C2H2-type domain-containing protein n=1 Tax=Capsella rubella TaxID=81985 RepID=R0I2G7_9BRAS|nr:uncharacterized protein LOC17893501 [Capsella rubella]EOA32095.1 hypothetical protein CARUB_v10015344mg [Capsella rubella]
MKRTRDAYEEDESFSSESEEFHQKLKVKFEEERSEDEDDESPQQLPLRKHFCVICKKQFSSGKAYGGHVRIHSTEYNNKGKMKKKLKMKKKKRKIGLVKKDKEKEIDLIAADMEGKIRCCLCGKEFQTMHSLFGHMRRHPDRSWKGVRPPPPQEKFNLSYLGDDDEEDDDGEDDVDEDDSDVRSRSTMMSDVTQDVQEAACILMMISYTSSNCWDGIKKDMDSPKSEARSSSCYKGKDKVLGDGGMNDDKKGLIVDMKIEMEIEVKVNNPRDDPKRSLGFDLNQPPHHEDHPYSSWN